MEEGIEGEREWVGRGTIWEGHGLGYTTYLILAIGCTLELKGGVDTAIVG